MVRAILEGKKTQTRRVVGLEDVNKNPDAWTFHKLDTLNYMTKPSAKGKFGAYFESELMEPNTLSICPQVFPYGQPGHTLWVREAWALLGPAIVFRADSPDGEYEQEWIEYGYGHGWKPSIHLPRVFARLTLRVKSVRVQRLQSISEQDAIAEGVTLPPKTVTMYDGIYRKAFAKLWDSINAQRGHTWQSNPWVWAIEFEIEFKRF